MGADSCKYNIEEFMLKTGFNIEETCELYTELIEEFNNEIADLKSYLQQRDTTRIMNVIHNMKGISANYNILDVNEQAEKIEYFFKSGNTDQALNMIEYFIDLIEHAKIQIASFFS